MFFHISNLVENMTSLKKQPKIIKIYNLSENDQLTLFLTKTYGYLW